MGAAAVSPERQAGRVSRYLVTMTAASIHLPEDSPLYGESAVRVSLEDEAAGIFLVIDGSAGPDQQQPGIVRIDVDQFDELVHAVRVLTADLDLDAGRRKGVRRAKREKKAVVEW